MKNLGHDEMHLMASEDGPKCDNAMRLTEYSFDIPFF
jgi:C4-type Zn-finger protein